MGTVVHFELFLFCKRNNEFSFVHNLIFARSFDLFKKKLFYDVSQKILGNLLIFKHLTKSQDICFV